jgi:hypothetical protein
MLFYAGALENPGGKFNYLILKTRGALWQHSHGLYGVRKKKRYYN